jgi:hypothetical protein
MTFLAGRNFFKKRTYSFSVPEIYNIILIGALLLIVN